MCSPRLNLRLTGPTRFPTTTLARRPRSLSIPITPLRRRRKLRALPRNMTGPVRMRRRPPTAVGVLLRLRLGITTPTRTTTIPDRRRRPTSSSRSATLSSRAGSTSSSLPSRCRLSRTLPTGDRPPTLSSRSSPSSRSRACWETRPSSARSRSDRPLEDCSMLPLAMLCVAPNHLPRKRSRADTLLAHRLN